MAPCESSETVQLWAAYGRTMVKAQSLWKTFFMLVATQHHKVWGCSISFEVGKAEKHRRTLGMALISDTVFHLLQHMLDQMSIIKKCSQVKVLQMKIKFLGSLLSRTKYK